MTSYGLVSGDASLPVTRTSLAVIQVKEGVKHSSTTEDVLVSFQGVMADALGSADIVRIANKNPTISRPHCSLPRSDRWIPSTSNMEDSQVSIAGYFPETRVDDASKTLEKRNIQMRLPS